jgi:hypothetical protein
MVGFACIDIQKLKNGWVRSKISVSKKPVGKASM